MVGAEVDRLRLTDARMRSPVVCDDMVTVVEAAAALEIAEIATS
jgi:hypothetical protein